LRRGLLALTPQGLPQRGSLRVADNIIAIRVKLLNDAQDPGPQLLKLILGQREPFFFRSGDEDANENFCFHSL
jgi:hypothetical protein